ncbi:MAG: hypothetical protein ACK4XG_10010 [Chromatiaceae bacterium]|jgi:hypothetical protein
MNSGNFGSHHHHLSPQQLKPLLQLIGKVQHPIKLETMPQELLKRVAHNFASNAWATVVITLWWLFSVFLTLLGLWQPDWLLTPFALLSLAFSTFGLWRSLPTIYSCPQLFVGDKGILWCQLETTGRVLAYKHQLYSANLSVTQTPLKGQTRLQISDNATGQSMVFHAEHHDTEANAILQMAVEQTNARVSFAKRLAAKAEDTSPQSSELENP